MKGKIDLINPLMINNAEVRVLEFDTNEITAQMFAEADTAKSRLNSQASGRISLSAEMDFSLHLYLGFMAITAVNPQIDLRDLERTKGHDVVKIMQMGRRFFLPTSGETSDQSKSESTSDFTPESSTPLSETPEPDPLQSS